MQTWSCCGSWDWKMSSRIPGKRDSALRLQCLQMQQKRIAQHPNCQHHKNVPLPHSLAEGRSISEDRGCFRPIPHMVLQQLNILLPKMSGHDFLVGDVADFHVVLHRQRHCHNILAI